MNRWVYANANPIRYTDPSGNSVAQSIISSALRRAGLGRMPGGISSYGVDCSPTGGKPDWLYFAIGTLDQYFEDMTIGIFKADDNYNNIQVYQQGRNFGHGISLTQAMIETIIGLVAAEAALTSIGATLGGGALCAGVTAGGCFIVVIPVIGVEVLVLVGASLVNIHGAAIIAKAAAEGGGGGGGWKPSSRLETAMKNAGRPRQPNSNAHHIVAQTDRRADEARKILERAGIGIDEADNGAWLPDVYHQKMHKPAYFQRVNDMLAQAEANGTVRQTLKYLGNAIETGNFP